MFSLTAGPTLFTAMGKGAIDGEDETNKAELKKLVILEGRGREKKGDFARLYGKG